MKQQAYGLSDWNFHKLIIYDLHEWRYGFKPINLLFCCNGVVKWHKITSISYFLRHVVS